MATTQGSNPDPPLGRSEPNTPHEPRIVVREPMRVAQARPVSYLKDFGNQLYRAGFAGSSAAFSNQQTSALASDSAQIDQAMQKLGVSATNVSRERVKFEADPNDWTVTWLKKKAWNFGVDILADNAVLITKYGTSFLPGIVDKLAAETVEVFNPQHLTKIPAHPDLARRYASQRWDQAVTLYNLYLDFPGELRKKGNIAKNSFYNLSDLTSKLEGYRHGGRVFVDLAQRKIAPLVGASMVMFAVYNATAARREATKHAFDSMFPRGSLSSPFTRNPVVKFALTKPIARVVGNPRLSAAALTYILLVKMGKSIRESIELGEQSPDAWRRLRESNRDVTNSERCLAWLQSIESTKGR